MLKIDCGRGESGSRGASRGHSSNLGRDGVDSGGDPKQDGLNVGEEKRSQGGPLGLGLSP